MINHAIWVPYLQRNPNDLIIPGWFMPDILLEISNRYLKRSLQRRISNCFSGPSIPIMKQSVNSQISQPRFPSSFNQPSLMIGLGQRARLGRLSLPNWLGKVEQNNKKAPACPSIFSLGHPGWKKNRFSECSVKFKQPSSSRK